MPQKRTISLFIKFLCILTLLIFSYSAYSFSSSCIFTNKLLKKEQYQVNAVSTSTANLNFNFQEKDNSYLDFYPEEIKQPASETSAVNSFSKSQKNTTTVDLQRVEEINRFLTLNLYKVNSNVCFADFDNLTGFLIQKQLKTNA